MSDSHSLERGERSLVWVGRPEDGGAVFGYGFLYGFMLGVDVGVLREGGYDTGFY